MKLIDCKQREWNLEIKISHAKRFIEQLNFDLIEGEIPSIIGRLMQEPMTRLKILWILIKPQADQLDVSEDDFWDSVGTSELRLVNDLLKESIVNFIAAHHPGSDSAVQASISRYGQILKKQIEMQVGIMENPEITKKVDLVSKQLQERFESELGKLSIDSLELVGEKSTRAPSGN